MKQKLKELYPSALSALEACATLRVYSSGHENLCRAATITSEHNLIRAYRGRTPRIPASCYIDESAVVIGNVTLGEDSSVWPCVVIRGDVHFIRIGARTNIQDGSVLHVMRDEHPLILGDNVTIGHGVVLHGCTIESRCLVGMGAIILNGAKIGAGSIIAAGTLIPEGTVVSPGSLYMGHPGKLRRALTDAEQKTIDDYAARYVEYMETYKVKEA